MPTRKIQPMYPSLDVVHRDTTALFHRIEQTAAAGDTARGNGDDALANVLDARRAALLAALDRAPQGGVR